MQIATSNASHPCLQRQQGIDAIKLIAILMVVTLHVLSHGGVFAACKPNSSTLVAAAFLESIAIIAVNLFVLASGYLGYGSNHSISRVIQLWLQTLFWSLLFGILFNALHLVPRNQISFKQLLFPILNGQNWYICTYFGLLPLMPILDKAVGSMTGKQSFEFASFGVILLSVVSFIAPADPFGVRSGYSLIWFALLYLVGTTLRANETTLRTYGKRGAFALTCAYAISQIVTFIVLVNKANSNPSGALGSRVLYYNAPAVFIASLALFMLLMRFKTKNIAMASTLATINAVILDVYLIHEHPLVRNVFITGRFSSIVRYGPIGLPLLTLLVVVTIFSICITLGYLRHCLFKTIGVRNISNKIGQFIKDAADRLFNLITTTFE